MKKRFELLDSSKIIVSYLGIFLMIIGVIGIIPLLSLIGYPEEVGYSKYFIIPSTIALILGYIIKKILPVEANKKLSLGQDALIVTVTWIVATLFSAIPFVISDQLNFTQAYFEAVSGWTTTGLSVVAVEEIPRIFLIHRSVMNFFGGVGIVLIMVSALSATYGLKLYNSEGHSDNLLPNLLKSSRLILSIYSGYVISGIILYCIFGMPLFDAINNSIAALSTGGFGVRQASIGAYNSFSIELITVILMILGTTNFAAHLLLIKGKFKRFFKLGEIRFMFILLGIFVPAMAFISLATLYKSLWRGLRVSLFEVVSALSTTGFSTVSYENWSSLSIIFMVILMIIGGGAGSTAGGIKLYRVYLMTKNLFWNVKKRFLPEHLVNENYVYKPEGKVFINESDMNEVSSYAYIYMVLYFIGVCIMLGYGYKLEDSLFEFASALGTVGLSIGITAASAPTGILWLEILGMLFGRLEIWIIFISIIKIFKDIKVGFKKKERIYN